MEEDILFGSKGLQTIVVAVDCSSGCSILGIIKVTPPTLQLDAPAALLLLVAAVDATAGTAACLLPFLGTDITLVDLSAFL